MQAVGTGRTRRKSYFFAVPRPDGHAIAPRGCQLAQRTPLRDVDPDIAVSAERAQCDSLSVGRKPKRDERAWCNGQRYSSSDPIDPDNRTFAWAKSAAR